MVERYHSRRLRRKRMACREAGPREGAYPQGTATPTPIVTQTPQPTRTETPSPARIQPFRELPIRGLAGLEGGRSLVVRGGTFIGRDPYQVDDSYGPGEMAPPIVNLASLANTFLGPYAYGLYLNSQKPNVNALLEYSQSPQGTLVTQVEVHNTSGQPIRASVQILGSGTATTQSESQWLLEGQRIGLLPSFSTSSDPEELPSFLSPDESAEVRVLLVAGFNDPPLLRTISFQVPSAERSGIVPPHSH